MWYLAGEWEGTGGGQDFSVHARAMFEWALNDHFIVGFNQVRDSGSDQVLSTEHIYVYYDRDQSQVVGAFFADDGAVEQAVGQVDARGELVLNSASLSCVPRSFPRARLRRVFQPLDRDRWVYAIEMDCGNGLLPYITVQMQRVPPAQKG